MSLIIQGITPNPTIDEIREAKNEAERAILSAISEFHTKTNLRVSGFNYEIKPLPGSDEGFMFGVDLDVRVS